MAGNPHGISLEPASQAFADATSTPPFIYEMSPEQGRKTLDEVQRSPIDKPAVDEKWITVQGGPTGQVAVRIVRPLGAAGPLPVIVYTHGAGWVLGDAHTHDRLVRDLAIGSGAAVVFPEYDRAPEAQYPIAIEQCYTAAKWAAEHGADERLDSSRIAIAGDSCGGNIAIAITLLAKERGDIAFAHQVLFYPVTNADFDTESYLKFANGYFLTRPAMMWFWDQYLPDHDRRAEITVSPLRATTEQLAGLPPALVITDEADVLRDEGEAYAAKLRAAGVPVTAVRYSGMTHDFVMLHALHDTQAARAAIAQATAILAGALHP